MSAKFIIAAASMVVAAAHTEKYNTFSSGLLFLHSDLITGTLARLELSMQQHPTLSSVALGTLARFSTRGAASELAILAAQPVSSWLATAFKPHLL